MDWSRCAIVERIPGKMGGAPVLRNTRMPADGVLANAEDMTPEEIAEDFDLDVEDVRTVIAFSRTTRELSFAS